MPKEGPPNGTNGKEQGRIIPFPGRRKTSRSPEAEKPLRGPRWFAALDEVEQMLGVISQDLQEKVGKEEGVRQHAGIVFKELMEALLQESLPYFKDQPQSDLQIDRIALVVTRNLSHLLERKLDHSLITQEEVGRFKEALWEAAVCMEDWARTQYNRKQMEQGHSKPPSQARDDLSVPAIPLRWILFVCAELRRLLDQESKTALNFVESSIARWDPFQGALVDAEGLEETVRRWKELVERSEPSPLARRVREGQALFVGNWLAELVSCVVYAPASRGVPFPSSSVRKRLPRRMRSDEAQEGKGSQLTGMLDLFSELERGAEAAAELAVRWREPFDDQVFTERTRTLLGFLAGLFELAQIWFIAKILSDFHTPVSRKEDAGNPRTPNSTELMQLVRMILRIAASRNPALEALLKFEGGALYTAPPQNQLEVTDTVVELVCAYALRERTEDLSSASSESQTSIMDMTTLRREMLLRSIPRDLTAVIYARIVAAESVLHTVHLLYHKRKKVKDPKVLHLLEITESALAHLREMDRFRQFFT